MRGGRLLAAGAILAAPLPVHAQRLGGAAGPEISLVRIAAALVLCLGAAVALALLISRRSASRGPIRWRGLARLHGASRIAVLESRRVSPHADVCLVRCDGRDYLLACGAGVLRVLARTAAEPDAGETPG